MKTGFIGLGIMGKPMAKHLLSHGFEVAVSDLNLDAVKELTEAGAEAAAYKEMGEACDVIITMLPNGSIVKDVLFGENGVAAGLQPGSVVCDMSSVTPVESQYCQEELAKKGVAFMDAPVSGGEPGAVNGTLAIMAGGDEETFERMQPYFNAFASSSVLIGPCGSGSVAKLANQIIVNNTIAVVSEAFVFAAKAGADPAKVYEAIRGGLAGSAVLDAKIPMILRRDFKPGGSLTINRKDIMNVVNSAHQMDIPVPYSAQLFEIMQYLKVHGHMGDDHGGIVQYFEELADVKVEPKN